MPLLFYASVSVTISLARIRHLLHGYRIGAIRIVHRDHRDHPTWVRASVRCMLLKVVMEHIASNLIEIEDDVIALPWSNVERILRIRRIELTTITANDQEMVTVRVHRVYHITRIDETDQHSLSHSRFDIVLRGCDETPMENKP